MQLCFVVSLVFGWGHYQYSPRQRCNNRNAEESMTCKLWQGYSGDISVLTSSGQQDVSNFTDIFEDVSLPREWFVNQWTPRAFVTIDSFNWMPVKAYVWFTREKRDFLVPVNRHLVLRTLRLRRLESSHCFKLPKSWVRDENNSSGSLEATWDLCHRRTFSHLIEGYS